VEGLTIYKYILKGQGNTLKEYSSGKKKFTHKIKKMKNKIIIKIGPNATKNVVQIDSLQVKQWFNGEDLEINEDYDGFVIIKHNNDFLGTGKYKDGKVLNYVGKGRRVNVNIPI